MTTNHEDVVEEDDEVITITQEDGNVVHLTSLAGLKATHNETRGVHEDESQGEDMVNSPPHYNKAGIECIDAIAAATGDGYEHYLQGNIMKYLWRYRYKNGTEDLKKAQWYLTKLIEEVEGCYDES